MDDQEHIEKHLDLDKQSLQVTALTTQANIALDTLNFIQAVHDKNVQQFAPEQRCTIPKETELKEAAVDTLLRYLKNGQS